MKTLFEYLESLADRRGIDFGLHFVVIVIVAWLPAQLLSHAIIAIHPGPRGVDLFSSPWRAVTAVILLAPILETLVMRFTFLLLRKITEKKHALLLASAAVWGLMHCKSENWGIPAVWAFYVFSIIYLQAEKRSSDYALLLTTTVHVFFNALAYGLYLWMPK